MQEGRSPGESQGGPQTGKVGGSLPRCVYRFPALTAIAEDETEAPRYEKVRMHRPEDLADACFTPAPVGGERIERTQRYGGTNECSSIYYPAFSSPRQAAGSPLANDIVKCQLKPLDRSDYNVTFTEEEWDRLQTAFADGVCDFSRPGVGQVPSETWLRHQG